MNEAAVYPVMALSEAQQALAVRYAPTAMSAARQYSLRSAGRMSIDDARSAALLGLCQGLEAWPGYCARNPGFDPSREDYLRAYLLRRIHGAVLDEARSADHLTRNDRRVAKSLRQAEEDGAHGIAQVAAVTGTDLKVARRVEAAAIPPKSLDDVLVTAERGQIPEDGPGTESQAAVRATLEAVVTALDSLPLVQQILIALTFHQGADIAAAAAAVCLTTGEARRQLELALCELHQAMLRSVTP